ncbi:MULTISPECIES: hypothetical protein [unclassified Sphingomonas]|uniref:hypothetical protein n=1 Tax=unclassified Sphingomonas TaxID=196159 RepID=UPI002855B7AA|nr:MULTISPECIES: hypothetical protein [unclassified Sphingomonas]MDR6116009.1 hypothetical protein [Sphingomonas sp. SORGH_AS_0789]MDR6150318.1 hypothetical protein [Sphingomonas sp. SORGH_AS_0742]
MKNILIAAPSYASRRERSLRRDDAFGAQFESALVELTRTLEGPSAIDAILVPWREDTRALIAVAAMDAAPSFDPEEAVGRDERQSRLIPYHATDNDIDLADDSFWQASHLSLGRREMPTFEAAVKQYRPSYVIMLGDPPQPDLIRISVMEHGAKVLAFGSLVQPGQLAERLGLPQHRIVDLEVNVIRTDAEDEDYREGSATERRAEDELEPFIPFGLLIQESLDNLLFSEEIRRGD